MNIKELITEAVQALSPQEAKDRKMFGPVYHGTSDIDTILTTGFSIKHSVPKWGVSKLTGRPIGTANGYNFAPYAAGIAAPVHHLGFGSYFTTVKAIAKQYNGNTTRGMKIFYLDTQNVKVINFGAPNTMMRWWLQNGYDMTVEATKNQDFKAWIKATGNLTRNLRKQCDAVWFKGKGIRKLLDGDQVCVFNPRLIYVIDPKLASGLEIGGKVTHTGKYSLTNNSQYIDELRSTDFGKIGNLGPGWKGVFWAHNHEGKDIPREGNYPRHIIPPPGMIGTIVEKRLAPDGDYMFDVKWQKGGIKFNYRENELQPIKASQSTNRD